MSTYHQSPMYPSRWKPVHLWTMIVLFSLYSLVASILMVRADREVEQLKKRPLNAPSIIFISPELPKVIPPPNPENVRYYLDQRAAVLKICLTAAGTSAGRNSNETWQWVTEGCDELVDSQFPAHVDPFR